MNLGIGIPVLASNYLPEGVEIELQARPSRSGSGSCVYKNVCARVCVEGRWDVWGPVCIRGRGCNDRSVLI